MYRSTGCFRLPALAPQLKRDPVDSDNSSWPMRVPRAFGDSGFQPRRGLDSRTRDEAEAMARQAAAQLRRAFEPLKVVEDVDVRTLDEGHVVPNIGPVNFP